MRNTILIIVLSLIAFGCSKEDFTTVPQLKYESVSNKILPIDQIIEFRLKFTDLEGDLQDTVFVEKIAVNCPDSYLQIARPFPTVPGGNMKSGDLKISFGNGINVPNDYIPWSIAPRCDENDTCFFRFVIKDKAQNKSDTAVSETIIILKN
jgi:hypothetical protein